MYDLVTSGNMYRGGLSGSDILTGLSRRKGGRWEGKAVYCFIGIVMTGGSARKLLAEFEVNWWSDLFTCVHQPDLLEV